MLKVKARNQVMLTVTRIRIGMWQLTAGRKKAEIMYLTEPFVNVLHEFAYRKTW